MAKTITFSIQKGGVSKTTTTGIVAYLLSQEGYKILVVDMDSQGNVTNLLTQMEQEEYEDETIMDAFRENNPKKYIIKASENIDVLPADDFLALFPEWIYTVYVKAGNQKVLALRELLAPLQDDYDFILVDTPPSLSEQTTNAVVASDYAVVLTESSKWAYTAISRFLATTEKAKETHNPDLKVLGILRTMNDARRYDSRAMVDIIGESFPDLVFETVIKRKAATGRLAIDGFSENKELKEAISEYKDFYEELKNRMGIGSKVKKRGLKKQLARILKTEK